MSDNLEPIPPSAAVKMHLDALKDSSAEWTQTSHKSELRPFVEWCREEGGVDNLNALTGRDLYNYRIWRREGGYSKSKVDELAPKTLHSNLSTLRSFLRFCAEIDAVEEDLCLSVPLPTLGADDEVSDSKIVPDRVPPILDYLERYHNGSRDHVIWTLLWRGLRTGAIRSIDDVDLELDGREPGIDLRHRPETGTPLKNNSRSERYLRLTERDAQTLQDWIQGPRPDVTDDHGRRPLIATAQGRASASCIRDAVYRWTRPCARGDECPHDRDPETCEATEHSSMSKCPSSRSPHDVRKARVTKYRSDGVPRGVVSDELDASEQILDKHYDRASRREKAARRWDIIRGNTGL
ncbi:tyrosine-type recombinase/integrase [Halogeometricum borinquense]|uniref:tyrosine-type recombinase/integrase n=1 Tax=Halogeometricum borinquense TaxID=60847 RepID=UPI0034158785